MPNTVRLHRVLATRPEKVYRAFLEADALAKWLPPNGFACTVHHLEPKVGGTFKRVTHSASRRRKIPFLMTTTFDGGEVIPERG
jgi:uncharacterized protein YndB with AHSA1/START domain